MKISVSKFWVLLVGAWAVVATTVLLIGLLAWFDLDAQERELIAKLLGQRAAIAVLVLVAAFGALAAWFKPWWRAHVDAPRKLAEQARLLFGANPALRLPTADAGAAQLFARSINQLADERDALRQDVEAQIHLAKTALEEERNRLAALMADLPQSVVVCNLDGRILLYNKRARLQFKVLAPDAHAPGALIGLGRSIYAAFDRALISHALETLQARIERVGSEPLASFVTTTRGGQLLRVLVAPVLAAGEAPTRSIAGYVLTLENITRFVDSDAKRDEAFRRLAEGGRASLARVRAAVEGMLSGQNIDTAAPRETLENLSEELRDLAIRLENASNEYAESTQSRWPLEDILAGDLLAAMQRRIEARIGVATKADNVPTELWVRVDSFSLMQAMTYLATRLKEIFDVRVIRLRVSNAEQAVHLDLLWSGTAISSETLHGWQHEPMSVAGEASPLTLREVMLRHGGEIRHGRETAAQLSFFRLVLPATQAHESLDTETNKTEANKTESRPEYYDFDLFGESADADSHANGALDAQPLRTLVYTVFDTETTGLNPAGGDEIIQIGAVRIVNGRLLRHENFDQLVDPHRPLSPQSIEVHGITEDMLRGHPRMGSVLPQFHAFCADTILVAHNAAFDMRFLQIKEAATGIAFRQPVLDTLLLSAVIHPNQAEHSLEAIAERLGVNLMGRHTALGDAILTAEVFLKMIPLLLDQGITTLGQARLAAEKTYYARVKY